MNEKPGTALRAEKRQGLHHISTGDNIPVLLVQKMDKLIEILENMMNSYRSIVSSPTNTTSLRSYITL